MKRQTTGKGAQIGATAIIWGLATAIMGISIPIIAITQSGPILALAIIGGATTSTIAVWWPPSRHRANEIADLQNTVQTLQTRLTALEIICNSQDLNS